MNHNDTRTSKSGSAVLDCAASAWRSRSSDGSGIRRVTTVSGICALFWSGDWFSLAWSRGWGIGNLTAPAAGSGAVNMRIPCRRPRG